MKKVLVVIALLAILAAGTARADDFTLLSTGTDLTNITIHDPGGTAGTTAGLFNVKFGSPGTVYDGFCVDYATVYWNTPYSNYSKLDITPTNTGSKYQAYAQDAWVFGHYQGFNFTPVAAQVAIWELTFEQLTPSGTVGDLGSGNFYVVSGVGSQDLADAYTLISGAQAAWAEGISTSGYALLVSPTTTSYYGDNFQDFIVHVPEPFTLLFLGACLVGAGVAGRRFKK